MPKGKKDSLKPGKYHPYLQTLKPTFARPSFSATKQRAARLEGTLATGTDYTSANLTQEDLAAPHRAPYAKIRDMVFSGSKKDVKNMVEELCNASKHYEQVFRKVKSDKRYHDLANYYTTTRERVEKAYASYNKTSLKPNETTKKGLITALNNLASNAPGLGPHSTANIPVSDRLHIHPTDEPTEPITPRSKAALAAFPKESVATTLSSSRARQVVSVTGARHTPRPYLRQYHDVTSRDRVVRGALFVNAASQLFKPKNPFSKPTGSFTSDWVQVK